MVKRNQKQSIKKKLNNPTKEWNMIEISHQLSHQILEILWDSKEDKGKIVHN